MDSTWIVIVNYRTADLVVDCLSSLAPQIQEFNKIRVVVVDNNSGDGSAAKLSAAIERETWAAWAEVMPLDRNGGFAFGNNAGIRKALSSPEPVDYIMLLNPDTVALPGAIKALVGFMDAHPEVGIAGSELENADGSLEYSAHAFPSPLGELDGAARLGVLSRWLRQNAANTPTRNSAHRCGWVSGASMIFRRQVIENIGLMDEGFFLYFEEVDICRRAHAAGWQCWYVPASRIIHLEGAATGIRAAAKRRAGYWYDSRRRYFVKSYGVSGLVVADLLWAVGRFSYLVRKVLRLGAASRGDCDPKWYTFDLLWGDLKAILTGRVWKIPRAGGQS
ncbi:MAG: glycosyltransferase family 2 protein [Gammaproteobacteria bacterium]|nr:glycosyltransferase family 2 protein [Gammaproteobacteria bacterium]MBU1483033.1 glycosyltransferase family 2 protein [Gammaproteobacteria bacterium]